MISKSHIRSIVLIVVIGGTMVAGWTGAAAARQIGPQTVSISATPVATPEPAASCRALP